MLQTISYLVRPRERHRLLDYQAANVAASEWATIQRELAATQRC